MAQGVRFIRVRGRVVPIRDNSAPDGGGGVRIKNSKTGKITRMDHFEALSRATRPGAHTTFAPTRGGIMMAATLSMRRSTFKERAVPALKSGVVGSIYGAGLGALAGAGAAGSFGVNRAIGGGVAIGAAVFGGLAGASTYRARKRVIDVNRFKSIMKHGYKAPGRTSV